MNEKYEIRPKRVLLGTCVNRKICIQMKSRLTFNINIIFFVAIAIC